MPVLTFPANLKPLRSSTIQTTYKTKQAQFGQGYKQSSPAQINNREYTINAEFILDATQRTTLLDFIESTKGHLPFEFSMPGYQPGHFTIEGPIQESQTGYLYKISVAMKTFNIPMELVT